MYNGSGKYSLLSNDNWSDANKYKKSIFSTLEFQAYSANEAVRFMNDRIYDFFNDNYGTINCFNQPNGPFRKFNLSTIDCLRPRLH